MAIPLNRHGQKIVFISISEVFRLLIAESCRCNGARKRRVRNREKFRLCYSRATMSFIATRYKDILAGWQTNKRGFARNKNHETDQEYVAWLLK